MNMMLDFNDAYFSCESIFLLVKVVESLGNYTREVGDLQKYPCPHEPGVVDRFFFYSRGSSKWESELLFSALSSKKIADSTPMINT